MQNELLFSDLPGSEALLLRTGGNHELRVGRDADISVEGNTTASHLGDRTTRIDHNDQLVIEGNATTLVGGTSQAAFRQSRDINVGDNLSEVVNGNVLRQSASLMSSIVGDHLHEVGGRYDIAVRAPHDPEASPGLDRGVGTLTVTATGEQRFFAEGAITMRSDSELRLFCGESSVVITPTAVRIESPTIELLGGERTSIQGENSTLQLDRGAAIGGGSVVVSSGGATLLLDADAHLDGGLVKLNCGSGGGVGQVVGEREEEVERVHMTFLDDVGIRIEACPSTPKEAASASEGTSTPMGPSISSFPTTRPDFTSPSTPGPTGQTTCRGTSYSMRRSPT